MQVWRLTLDGHAHRVEASSGVSRRVRWSVDDELVAEKKSADGKVRLEAPIGQVEVRFSGTGAPRRATYVGGGEQVDLVPDPGPAADHEDRVRAHPHRYAAIATLTGFAKVVVPIVLATLLARFAFSLPWPDWHLPTPDLPSVPSLPLPSIPLPDWSLPGWVRWTLDKATYVWPVVLAFVLARAEINRRRQQDERRDELEG